MPAATSRSDPGGFTRPPDAGQRHARRNARFLAGRAGAADRRAPHRRQRAISPAPSRFAAAAPTAPSSSPTSGRPSTAASMRAASTSGAVTLARLTANAKLVNGAGQVRAAFAGRRGAAFAFSTLADVTPGRDPPDRQRPDRAPAAGAQPGGRADPLRRRLGAGADQPQLRRRHRDRLGPQRLAARGPRAGPGACRSRCSTCSGPTSTCRARRPAALDYAWKGNRSGRLDLKVRGLSRAGLVLASKPIDVGIAAIVNGNQAALRAVAASDGAIVGRAQARFAPHGRRPAGGRADERAAVRAASLHRARRHLVAADRQRGASTCPARWRSARTSAAGLPTRSSAARSRPQNARLESPVTGMVIDQCREPGALLRSAADLQPDFRADAGRRIGHGQRHGHLLRRQDRCSTCRSTPTRRCCSTATMSPRGSRARCRSARTATAARSRATSSSTRAASSSAGRAPPPRCRSSTCAKPGSTPRT